MGREVSYTHCAAAAVHGWVCLPNSCVGPQHRPACRVERPPTIFSPVSLEVVICGEYFHSCAGLSFVETHLCNNLVRLQRLPRLLVAGTRQQVHHTALGRHHTLVHIGQRPRLGAVCSTQHGRAQHSTAQRTVRRDIPWPPAVSFSAQPLFRTAEHCYCRSPHTHTLAGVHTQQHTHQMPARPAGHRSKPFQAVPWRSEPA